MRNKKGFTLVELLVVIVILGIITGISIPLIRNLQSKNEDKKYTTYMDSMRQSAKLYVDSYQEDLFGHKTSGCAIIKYSQLEEKGLLKDIPLNDVTCNSEDTFVKVVKLDNKISYSLSLGCGSKKADGTANVDTRIPEGGMPGLESCGETKPSVITIFTSPTQSTAINVKKKNVKVNITSNTGIHEDINIFYSFVKKEGLELTESVNPPTNPIGGWKKLNINYMGGNEQKQLIENGNVVTLSSNNVTTPDDLTGDYYIVLRIDTLKDLAGINWTSTNTKYLYRGPFRVDNTKPVFSNDSTVISSDSNYNHLKPKLKINVTDNYTQTNDLKMCISFDNDTCTKIEKEIKAGNGYSNYEANKVLDDIHNTYDGSTHTVYVTVGDAAGNYTTQNYTYKIATRRTLTYNSNGGNTCDPSSKSVTYDETAPTWGTLCTPTRTNYEFTGWNTKADGTGTAVTSSTTANSSMTIYAGWKLKKAIIFTYSGNFAYKDGNGSEVTGTSNSQIQLTGPNYYIKLLSSGTLTVVSTSLNVDIFASGGGGGGGGAVSSSTAGAGGAGGNYVERYNVTIGDNASISVTIGGGGAAGADHNGAGGNGGTTSLSGGGLSISATGGRGALKNGRGGRADGANGAAGGDSGTNGTNGRCAFNDCGFINYKYSGGGGGGQCINCSINNSGWCGVTKEAGHGGASGGGGTGSGGDGHPGKANSSGGGGGGSPAAAIPDSGRARNKGGPGGTGIVIIRNKR